MVTDKQLALLMPHLPASKRALYLPALNAAMQEFGINTRTRTCAFLANLAVESIELTTWGENLNYSPEGLMRVFKKYFPNVTLARFYAHKPEQIANRVYANRGGNGPESSGDGWKYRGGGPIQTTLKDNYVRTGIHLNLPLRDNPDLLRMPERDPAPGLRAASFFFSDNRLNRISDLLKGKWDRDEEQTFKSICKIINGGYNGLPERVQYYKRALAVISDTTTVGVPVPAGTTKPRIEPPTPPPSVAQTPSAQSAPTPEAQTVKEQMKETQSIDALVEMGASDQAKGIFQSLWARTGGRVVTFFTWLGAAVKAGDVAVILGLIVVIAGVALYLYVKRRAIARIFHIVMQKVEAKFGKSKED
jgi:putative chitinase